MNRRDFIKSGIAALVSVWCVRQSEESVIAEIKTEKSCYDCGEMTCSVDCSDWWNRPYFAGPGLPTIEKETESLEYNCGSCPWYMCAPDCPSWWDRPYFVPSSDYRKVLPRPQGLWSEHRGEYGHWSDLGIRADRNPSKEYVEWKLKTKRSNI